MHVIFIIFTLHYIILYTILCVCVINLSYTYSPILQYITHLWFYIYIYIIIGIHIRYSIIYRLTFNLHNLHYYPNIMLLTSIEL